MKRMSCFFIVFISLILLSACAAPPPRPSRPVAATQQAADCLRQCDAICAACTGNANANSRTPMASTTGGVLLSAMADSSSRNGAIQTCYETLNICYDDCNRFYIQPQQPSHTENQQGKSAGQVLQ